MGRGGAQLGKALKGAGLPKKDDPDFPTEKSNELARIEKYQKEMTIMCGLRHRLEMMVEENRHNERVSQRQSNGKWRQMLRQRLSRQLHQETGFDFFQVIRKAESKRLSAFRLIEYLKQLDHQTRTSYSKSASQVEFVIELYNRYMLCVKKAFERVGNGLRLQEERNLEELAESHRQALAKAKSSIADLWADESARSTMEMQAFETERESMRNRHLEVIHMLKVTTNIVIEKLESRFDSAHRSYVEMTDDRSHEFAALKTSDRRLSEQIERHVTSIDRISLAIHHWRKALARLTTENRTSIAALQAERDIHYKSYQDLYSKFREIRLKETASLTRCSSRARDNARRLREALDTCQRILKIALVVEKAQTTQERADRRPITEQLGRAQVDIVQSKLRRDAIRKENEQLRGLIAKYLEGIKVGPNTVNESNPLLVINGRSGVQTLTRIARRRPTVVDAGMLAKAYAMQTAEV